MQRIRKNDILARYGGEEFLFVLPQTDLRNACKVTSSFKAATQDIRISLNSNNDLSLTISCGVSTAYPAKEGDSIDALVQRADKALYDAKRSGKNRIAFKETEIQ
jgi:diguanylate cyclase (GGDEF)-like protein